jgi:hypothetical protein
LNVDRTLGGIDGRVKLRQQAIAHGFHHASTVSVDKRVHQRGPINSMVRQSPDLIRALNNH